MKINTDENGLIITPWGDGGDTAHSEGIYWIGNKLLKTNNLKHDFALVIALLQVEPGVFVRHPYQYPDPKDFSRDQTVPLLIAMGFWNEKTLLKSALKKQFKNYFRYQNNDVGFFQDLNYYIRSLKWWFLYPLLLIGDLVLLINTLVLCFWTTRTANKFFWWLNEKLGWWWLVSIAPPNHEGVLQEVRGPYCTTNDLNNTLALIQASETYPTPLTWITKKIYKYFRPYGIQWAWDTYYTFNNPLGQFMKPLIDRYF